MDFVEFRNDIQLKIANATECLYKDPKYNIYHIFKSTFEAEVFKSYLDYKQQINKIDYTDMVINCHRLLSQKPQVLDYRQNRFSHFMTDEFQDTSLLQAEVFFMLSKDNNICVAGDDDRYIYAFRGADKGIFDAFLSRYANTNKIFMTTNYRSLPQIIKCAARGVPYQNIAVLYRIKKEASSLWTLLKTQKIPFYISEVLDNIYKEMGKFNENLRL